MIVIPVINCPDIECVKKKVAAARAFLPAGGTLHLDVTDGSFTAHKTWHDAAAWPSVSGGYSLEVHLMVERPDEAMHGWIAAGVKRIIVPVESLGLQSAADIIEVCERNGVVPMLSSNPDTPAEAMKPYLQQFEAFQVLAVHPGAAGQTFIDAVLPKITFLRERVPHATIEVDGGIDPGTAHAAGAAGADTVVSEHYIFETGDPKKAYEALLVI